MKDDVRLSNLKLKNPNMKLGLMGIFLLSLGYPLCFWSMYSLGQCCKYVSTTRLHTPAAVVGLVAWVVGVLLILISVERVDK